MSFLEAIILGLIQGLTEFIPISSSGHLTLYGKLSGLINESSYKDWTSFIATIQLGTLLAVFVYFFKDLYLILKNFINDNLLSPKKINLQSSESKLGWLIIVGNIPIVVVGLLFKDFIEGAITKNLIVISCSLIILGIILAIADKTGKFNKEIKELTFSNSLIIGLAQVLSLIPGSSRSGTTITAALFLGIKRSDAARFSFLLGIPAIMGSGLLELKDVISSPSSYGLDVTIIATLVSFISGYFAIDFLIKYLKKHSTFLFVNYRIIIGIVILLLIYNNFITI